MPISDPEVRGGHQQQIINLLDVSPHVVGQPAVGKGDVGSPLENGDLGILIGAPRLRGRAGAGSNAADHHNSSWQLSSLEAHPHIHGILMGEYTQYRV